MTPFFFGPSERRLFGVYDPAHDVEGATRGGAVICHPWGSEYIYAHRSLRQLAMRLSRSGIETLRFDYFGTGDSAGEMTDADLAGWKGDIEAAIEELTDLTGTKAIALIGLRLGANLAASVAAKRRQVNPLILWDPIVSGKTYLQECGIAKGDERSLAPLPVVRADNVGGGYELDGFPLTRGMAHEFENLDLTEDLADISANTLVILSARMPWLASLQRGVKQMSRAHVELELLEDRSAWVERPETIEAIPVKVISRIVDWITQCE